MLVLSRKEKQQIVFPKLDISIEVTKISGKVARIAIDAPKHIRVLRGELVDQNNHDSPDISSREQRHNYRNRIHTAQMALGLLQKQLASNLLEHAEETLQQVIDAFKELEPCVQSDQVNGAQESTPKALRALIIEDNANERELLVGFLRMSGYDVQSVPDGLAAMEHLTSHELPDFVLMDMQMPKMDGKQTINAIRSNDQLRDLKIYALTGLDRSSCNIPIGRNGVNRWFCKPIQPGYLASELGREVINN